MHNAINVRIEVACKATRGTYFESASTTIRQLKMYAFLYFTNLLEQLSAKYPPAMPDVWINDRGRILEKHAALSGQTFS